MSKKEENNTKPFQTANFAEMNDNMKRIQGLMKDFSVIKLKQLERQLLTLADLVKMDGEMRKAEEEKLKKILEEL